jgi:subtilisin family serine protease
VWLFARPSVPLDSVGRWVAARGGVVRRASRWLHAVSAVLPPAALDAARGFTGLARVQPVARYRRAGMPDLVEPVAALPIVPFRAPAQDSLFGPAAMPVRRLNLVPLVDHGLRGAGVRVAVFDSGFETELATFAGASIGAQYDFVFNDSIVRNEPADAATASSHGTSVWSLLAARVPGTMMGIAPDATFLLAKTEDVRSETPLEEDNYVAALEWADSLGAHLVSSSLGYLGFDGGSGYAPGDLNGDIAVTTRAADSAVARGIVVVTAMGNEGPAARTLITPADGDSVLGVGAEDSTGVIATFSSRGPTADNRIKPDLVAPGQAIWVAIPQQGGTVAYGRGSGTSFATPILAGGATLFLEAHPGFEPIALREALRRNADQRAAPDNARGWGRPDVHTAAVFPRGVVMTGSGDTLTSVVPRFTWSVPDAPAFAHPFTSRLRVIREDGLGTVLIDTTLSDTTVIVPDPLPGGERISWSLTVTSADSAEAAAAGPAVLTVPAWVTLETLNNPAGTTIRSFRPEFRWSSPDVPVPPGPFRYDLRIARADNAQVEVAADSLVETTFVPTFDLERNTPYRWSVTARLGDATEQVTSRGTFVIVDDAAPPVTVLFQNFPNPFPQPGSGQLVTCLWFDIAVEGAVRLEILDLRGVPIRRLIPRGDLGPILRAGRYGRPEPGSPGCDERFSWDGTAEDGERVNPGVYLAKLATAAGVFFKRIVFTGGAP